MTVTVAYNCVGHNILRNIPGYSAVAQVYIGLWYEYSLCIVLTLLDVLKGDLPPHSMRVHHLRTTPTDGRRVSFVRDTATNEFTILLLLLFLLLLLLLQVRGLLWNAVVLHSHKFFSYFLPHPLQICFSFILLQSLGIDI